MPPGAAHARAGPSAAASPSAGTTVLAWLLANKRKVLYGASAVVALYLARRAYVASSSPSAEPTRISKMLRTLQDLTQALGSLSSTSALVLTDLHAFLTSDADELPRSLRQLAKVAQSQEIQTTLQTSAVTLLRAMSAPSSTGQQPGAPAEPTALQQIIDAVLSDRGRTLVGMAVGLATKNATSTFCEFLERMQQGGGGGAWGGASIAVAGGEAGGEHGGTHAAGAGGPPSTLAGVVDVLASEQGERLISLLITKSIRTAVSTYVDATTGYNYYEDMVASIAKQEHRDAVSDVMSRVTAAFCRELALAYRTVQQPSSQQQQSQRLNGTYHQQQQQQQRGGLTPCLSSGSCSSATGSGLVAVATAGNGHAPGMRVAHSAGAITNGSAALAAAAALTQAVALTGGTSTPTAAAVAANGLGFSSRRHSCDDALALEQQQQQQQPQQGKGAGQALPPAPRNGLQQRPSSMSAFLQQAGVGGGAGAAATGSQVWLRPIIDLVRERDVRSLALEVVSSATREATRSTWEVLLVGGGRDAAGGGSVGLLVQYRTYILLSLLVSLIMYALSPRVIALA